MTSGRATIVGLVVLLGAVACYREAAVDRPRAQTLVLVHPAPWTTLDPRFVTDAMTAKVLGLIVEPLVRFERLDGEPTFVLATGVRRLEGPAPIWRFELRRGVRFHDGRPFDCRDVAFTYRSMLDPALGSPYQGGLARKWRAVRCGPELHQVDLELAADEAGFLADLATGIVPAGAAVDAPPIGTGPFQLVTDHGGRRALLERFDGWHGEPPAWRWLRIDVLPEEASRVLALVGGAADVVINGVGPAVARALEDEPGVRVLGGESAIVTYLLVNLRQPALADRRVRRALGLALDRPGILGDLFANYGRTAEGILPPAHWAAVSTPALVYDPVEAAHLLELAGFAPDPDTGVRLALTLKLSNARLRRLVGRRLAEDWARAGVAVEPRPFDLATFLADVRAGSFDLAVLQLPDTLEPDVLRWMFSSLNVPAAGDPKGATFFDRAPREGLPAHAWLMLASSRADCRAWARDLVLERLAPGSNAPARVAGYVRGNRTWYANPGVDCLLDLASRAPDRERRAALVKEAQRALAEDLPVIPLWREDNLAVVSTRVEGLSLSPVGRYTGLERIRLREEAP
jgi:peptide/nickel transport system substrate-binding protein